MAARKRRKAMRKATPAQKREIKVGIKNIQTHAANTLRSVGALKKTVKMMDCAGFAAVERHVKNTLRSVGALKKNVAMMDCW